MEAEPAVVGVLVQREVPERLLGVRHGGEDFPQDARDVASDEHSRQQEHGPAVVSCPVAVGLLQAGKVGRACGERGADVFLVGWVSAACGDGSRLRRRQQGGLAPLFLGSEEGLLPEEFVGGVLLRGGRGGEARAGGFHIRSSIRDVGIVCRRFVKPPRLPPDVVVERLDGARGG